MRKRIVVFFMLLASLCVFAEEAKEKKSDDSKQLSNFTLSVGDTFSSLYIKNQFYFGSLYSGDNAVVEILPVSDITCKLVLSVPSNNIGSTRNYVLYVNLGDLYFCYEDDKGAVVGHITKIGYNSIGITGSYIEK